MGLRFLILDTDYPEFLAWLYAQQSGLENKSAATQMQTRFDSYSGMADFYARHLRACGHEAETIYFNNEWAQKAWAREQGIKVTEAMRPARSHPPPTTTALTQLAKRKSARYLKPLLPLLAHLRRSLRSQPTWVQQVLGAQIEAYRPDIIINHSIGSLSGKFLAGFAPRLLVGQHAAQALSGVADFTAYDLMISSFPGTIDFFRRQGITAELNRLAFEPDVLSALSGKERLVERDIELSFIGSFYFVHRSRTELLEKLCTHFPQTKVWGTGIEQLSAKSPLQRCYVGPAWGLEMYRVLQRSQITFNHHGDVLPYANNMRLYEATGMGALLVTDWKPDLHELFAPGQQFAAYRSAAECIKLIEHYLTHDDEREAVARAGQRRTLSEHTYQRRVEELLTIIERHL